MPEIRTPYVTAPSPLEQAVSEMQAQLHWAAMLIVALLELQDMRTCPHCGRRLKCDPDPVGFDTSKIQ